MKTSTVNFVELQSRLPEHLITAIFGKIAKVDLIVLQVICVGLGTKNDSDVATLSIPLHVWAQTPKNSRVLCTDDPQHGVWPPNPLVQFVTFVDSPDENERLHCVKRTNGYLNEGNRKNERNPLC